MIFKQPLSGADNIKLYLSEAVLPPMIHGAAAPFMPPEGHKAHRNHIAVQPEPYRSRFTKVVKPKKLGLFNKAVLEFAETLPCDKLGLPNVEAATGFAFTIAARGFNIVQPPVPRPSTIHEVAPWVFTFPLQTLTRAVHVGLPETQGWDITYANDVYDPDVALWSTLVWRKTPSPLAPGAFLNQAPDPLEKCSVVFVVQPPWIMTPQDMNSFTNCEGLPPFNPWESESNRPFTSAERVWAKLWDTCVRRQCHHWVLSTYWGWVFGAFTAGFAAGQILDYKRFDETEPTIMQCLVYHVASSMGLVASSRLPKYLETLDQAEWNMDIPPPSRDTEVEFPDSGSEWDGMDDEPGISAGISNFGVPLLSAWGSEQEFCLPPGPLTASQRAARPPLAPASANRVREWQHRDENDEPPPYERELSPAFTESAHSNASIFLATGRGASADPEVKILRGHRPAIGGVLSTVVEQGPVIGD